MKKIKLFIFLSIATCLAFAQCISPSITSPAGGTVSITGSDHAGTVSYSGGAGGTIITVTFGSSAGLFCAFAPANANGVGSSGVYITNNGTSFSLYAGSVGSSPMLWSYVCE